MGQRHFSHFVSPRRRGDDRESCCFTIDVSFSNASDFSGLFQEVTNKCFSIKKSLVFISERFDIIHDMCCKEAFTAKLGPPILSKVRRCNSNHVSPCVEKFSSDLSITSAAADVPVDVLDHVIMGAFDSTTQVVSIHRIGPLNESLSESSKHPRINGMRGFVPSQKQIRHRLQLLHHSMIGLNSGVGPVHACCWVCCKENEQTDCICSKLFNHLFRRNGITKRFTHLSRTFSQG